MRNVVKVLIAVAFAAALAGCVIRPWHPHHWHHWRGLASVVAPAAALVRGS
jgi:hypothetical protein